MNTRAAVVMFVLFLAAAVGWGMYIKEHRRVVDFIAIDEARENLKNASANYQAALFISATDTTITYQVPEQVSTSDGTFVNYTDRTSPLAPGSKVYSPSDPLSGTAMQASSIPKGQVIRIYTEPGTTDRSQLIVHAIYIIE